MITINEKEYNLKYTLRALFIFERITNRQFSIESTLDQYLFFYCLILASNPDTQLTFDEFINACDEDKDLFIKMNKFYHIVIDVYIMILLLLRLEKIYINQNH